MGSSDRVPGTTQRILFLCTGNYYRSRFAEQLFNARALQAGLGWIADSRGIAAGWGSGNVGAMSSYTIAALQARGIAVETPARFPMRLQEKDLARADLIIALDEKEHRACLEARYPALAGQIEYWQVPDLDRASPEEALRLIEQEVDSLIERLSIRGGPSET